jgi:hypothetical protein
VYVGRVCLLYHVIHYVKDLHLLSATLDSSALASVVALECTRAICRLLIIHSEVSAERSTILNSFVSIIIIGSTALRGPWPCLEASAS